VEPWTSKEEMFLEFCTMIRIECFFLKLKDEGLSLSGGTAGFINIGLKRRSFLK
jgi:hypothetical protein